MARYGYTKQEIAFIEKELIQAYKLLPSNLTTEQAAVCYPQPGVASIYWSEDQVDKWLATPLPVIPPEMPAYVINLLTQKITVRSQAQVMNLYKSLTGKILGLMEVTFEDLIKQQVRKAKFERTICTILFSGNTQITVPGFAYRGLWVHKEVTKDGPTSRNVYALTHAASGLKISNSFVSQTDARIAAVRIAELADFTRTREYFIGRDNTHLWHCCKLLAEDVYAELPDAQ